MMKSRATIRRRWRFYATSAGRKPAMYEVRADGLEASYRLLFAEEGAKGRVLLALHANSKKTQRTPPQVLDLAERRLADWRRR